jgi:hypothetical protein
MSEVKIKHGLFWYYAPEPTVNAEGQEVTTLVEKLAMHNAVVDVPREADLDRGRKAGAFYTDEELAAQENGVEVEGEDATGSTSLADLDDDDLVDWLMAVGRFDGQKKPNVDEVVAAAGDDPEFAERMLSAEDRASGGDPRGGVESGLNKIIEE